MAAEGFIHRCIVFCYMLVHVRVTTWCVMRVCTFSHRSTPDLTTFGASANHTHKSKWQVNFGEFALEFIYTLKYPDRFLKYFVVFIYGVIYSYILNLIVYTDFIILKNIDEQNRPIRKKIVQSFTRGLSPTNPNTRICLL